MSCINLLEPDMSASNDDRWLRNITNINHVKPDGHLHHSALKVPAIKKNKTGNLELSGRLKSYAGTIDEIQSHGTKMAELARSNFENKGLTVPSGIQFVGIAHSFVDALRMMNKDHGKRIDVIYAPVDTDIAHSNIIGYEYDTEEDLKLLQEELQKKLKVTRGSDISNLFKSTDGD